jgi:sulfatase maturation enzyme AslB (radical SAM superfamily)
MTDLGVVVDNESLRNLASLQWRYFGTAKAREKLAHSYYLTDPLNRERHVRGILVPTPVLEEHTAEYLYLELTDLCNFQCKGCGVESKIRHTANIGQTRSDSVKYITDEFAQALVAAITGSPFPFQRNLFYGGGEPLINPKEFRRVHAIFKDLPNTDISVITNGCNLPLKRTEFRDFMEYIGRPNIYMTISPEHLIQYAVLRRIERRENTSQSVPAVEPDDALLEKAKIIESYCKRMGIKFRPLQLRNESGLNKGDLREHIIEKAMQQFESPSSVPFGERRTPCSKGQELAIRFNGDIYPYCTDIFNNNPKLGVIGLLKK